MVIPFHDLSIFIGNNSGVSIQIQGYITSHNHLSVTANYRHCLKKIFISIHLHSLLFIHPKEEHFKASSSIKYNINQEADEHRKMKWDISVIWYQGKMEFLLRCQVTRQPRRGFLLRLFSDFYAFLILPGMALDQSRILVTPAG